VLIGGGGHASDVLHAIEAANERRPTYDVVGILDDGEVDTRRLEGRNLTQIGTVDDLSRIDALYVLALGWPWTRQSVGDRVKAHGDPAPPIVHPRADIGAGAVLAPGTVVLGNTQVSPMAQLGPHSLVSYLAAVGHDTVFGAFGTVMPGAIVSGGVRAGDGVLVGAGAVIREGIVLGDGARVGAGAVVIDDVPEGTIVVSAPARPRP
jgi:sugar O-acyltransferase (sialic acid O-acetyltransferase NeuD family)